MLKSNWLSSAQVCGYSDVQGARTWGIWKKLSVNFFDALQPTYHSCMPRKHGYDTIKAWLRHYLSCPNYPNYGAAGYSVTLGGNFYRATLDHAPKNYALLNLIE